MSKWVKAIKSAIRFNAGAATEAEIRYWILSNTDFAETNSSIRQTLNQQLRRHCSNAKSTQFTGHNLFYLVKHSDNTTDHYTIIGEVNDERLKTSWLWAIREAIRAHGDKATEEEIVNWIVENTPLSDMCGNITEAFNENIGKYCRSVNSPNYGGHNYFKRWGNYGHSAYSDSSPFSYSIWGQGNHVLISSERFKTRTNKTPTRPPDNNGWDAEMFVADTLLKMGWEVSYVAHEYRGYDLYATKDTDTLCVEVKSSVNNCVPRLTENEYNKLLDGGCNFVLAILENFNPTIANEISWISGDDLTEIDFSPSTEIVYKLSRTAWIQHEKRLDDLF